MEHALIALALFASTAALSALLVWKAIDVGHRVGIVDRPTERGVSQRIVARTGGAPVAIAVLAGLALSFSFDVYRFPAEIERLLLLSVGGMVIVLIMLVDDATGMPARFKLTAQLGVAALVVLPRLRGSLHGVSLDQFNLPVTGQISLPVAIAIPVTILWFVGMMNAVNWSDGIDGMAASLSLIAAVVMFLHTYFWPRGDPQFTISLLALVLAGGIVGFLPFNWHPARIMLGDAGANFLGFMLAGLSIIGGAKMATALLVLGLPILDIAYVIARRGLSRRPLAGPDMTHLHHRLLRRGWSQAQVVLVASAVSLTFGLLALLLPNREAKLLALGVLALLMVLTFRQYRTDHAPDETVH
ncbi:MAG: undecaprenyl/decaprenyl-phosphate alpha-N-acetylglucosaminyl 1-phosphate transferase [Thermomicrobiales bacterium]|nr:undecaprenyl/decaprenyl-phosphate alpha-N-acetylglucosaminyl 1-phosphate transferase [Thermomicrobiales bacterium]